MIVKVIIIAMTMLFLVMMIGDSGYDIYDDSSHDHDDRDHFDDDVVSGCYVACLSFDYLASHVITCNHVCATGQDTACLCGDKVADGLRSQS